MRFFVGIRLSIRAVLSRCGCQVPARRRHRRVGALTLGYAGGAGPQKERPRPMKHGA
jgi:hypothetical protein